MPLSAMRDVDWGATVKLAAVRGFAAALVLTLLGLAFGAFAVSGIGGAFRFLLLWTVAGSIGGICYLWFLKAIDATIGQMVGIVSLAVRLGQALVIAAVAAGDPLVYLLNRLAPAFLDLADFKLFNFVAVIFVCRHDAVLADERFQ